MIRMNPNKIVANSAKIMFDGKVKYNFSEEETKNLYDRIEGIEDKTKKFDGELVLHYIINGRKIVLDKEGKKIHIYGQVTHGKVEPICTIEQNPKLYSLLKNFVQP
ncbi:MAG: hypothetical protein HFJ35_06685 [Clostridia bacterium]|nr:hypothetical protein [Clostridia bacterium]